MQQIVGEKCRLPSLARRKEMRMPKVDMEGQAFDVDEEGFLQSPELWNDQVACLFARLDGIEDLSEDHWKVVRYIRQYYEENGLAPMVRKICQNTGLRLRQIYELFPLGPAKGACKVAGLPKPDGCV
jgi:TusE/DsrC/DsvC family sulfur relay protein